MTGRIVAIYGNLVVAEAEGQIIQNSVGHCLRGDGARLLSEVIRVRGRRADLQVFDETRGLKIGDTVEFSTEMLSVVLGPGLLGQVYDGLQNPLPQLAEQVGYFLEPGNFLHALRADIEWEFTPVVAAGDTVGAGDALGTVPEGIFAHKVMAPFGLVGSYTVESVVEGGSYTVEKEIAVLRDEAGETQAVTMQQSWPVKMPLNVSKQRLMPTEPMVTGIRIVDSMFPVVRGGTYCIPGPFGAGKTVLQQITSRYAEVDIVIVATFAVCGGRYSDCGGVRGAGGGSGGDAAGVSGVDRSADG